MPIINVLSLAGTRLPVEDPAATFAMYAGIDQSLVTVNVIPVAAQAGNRYDAVVDIVIPDLWSAEMREKFLFAAAKTLENCFGVQASQSIVYVNCVRSGEVLDRGQVENW